MTITMSILAAFRRDSINLQNLLSLLAAVTELLVGPPEAGFVLPVQLPLWVGVMKPPDCLLCDLFRCLGASDGGLPASILDRLDARHRKASDLNFPPGPILSSWADRKLLVVWRLDLVLFVTPLQFGPSKLCEIRAIRDRDSSRLDAAFLPPPAFAATNDPFAPITLYIPLSLSLELASLGK